MVAIYPFVDGNGPALRSHEHSEGGVGRTARLLMNVLLLQHGYPLAIIQKEERASYIKAVQRALGDGKPEAFNAIIYGAVEYGLDVYVQAIAESNLGC